MELEPGASKSAPAEKRRAILHATLLQRRSELRTGWQRLITPECLHHLGSTAPKVVSLLSGPDAFHDWQTAPDSPWADCDVSLPECLILIGVGQSIAWQRSAAAPTALSCADLKGMSGMDRVEALSIRYCCPLNIGAQSESQIAEELLRQLMVVDRHRLEAESEFDVDDVLLKLSLTAICARMKRDLRFLDALNYFYELPRRPLGRLQRNPNFLASWLCLYAQLLCAPDW
jgi:hypothetical protein